MKNHVVFDRIVLILLILAGLNWGFVGLFGWDFIGAIFGEMSGLTRVIYVLMGLSSVYRFICWARMKPSKR